MELKNLAYPWMKDFDILVKKIEYLEHRVQYLEQYAPNQKPQYQGVSTNTTGGVYISPMGTGAAGGAGGLAGSTLGSGQAWSGTSGSAKK
jgi:hypothetical protein